TLDLNRLPVYARVTQINGAVINGTITILPDGGSVVLNTVTPGAISVAGEQDEWTFFARAGQAVTIIGNPGDGSPPSPVAPTLGWMDLRVLDPDGSEIASGSNSFSGQSVTLLRLPLSQDGTYRVRIRAPGSHEGVTGNYLL